MGLPSANKPTTDNPPPTFQKVQHHDSITISPGGYGKQCAGKWWCLDQGRVSSHPPSIHPYPYSVTIQPPQIPIPKNKRTTVCVPPSARIPGNRQRRAGGYLQLRAAPRPGRPIRSPRPPLCHRDGGTPTPSFPSPFCGTHTGCPFWGRPRFGLFSVCLSGGRRVCPNSVTLLLLLVVSPPRKWWWASCSFFFSPRGAAVVHARVGIFAQHTHPIHSFIPPFSTDLGLGKR